MERVDAPRRGSYGLSLLVALGWCVVVPAAVLVGLSGIPAAPQEDCSAIFSCLSPAEEAGLIMAFFGLPVLVGVVVATAVVAALLSRHVRSPVVTGTLSALCGVVGTAAVLAVWHGAQ
jgi:hypothetical protein